MITDTNSDERLLQSPFAAHLKQELGWGDTCEVVLKRDLPSAVPVSYRDASAQLR